MRKQRAKDRLRRLTKSPAKVKKSQVRSSPVRQQQQQQQRQQQPNSASRKREQLAQKNENDADLAMASPLVVLHRSPNKNNTHQRSESRSEQRLESRSEQHDDLADSGIVNSQANNAFDILGQVSILSEGASRIWKAL